MNKINYQKKMEDIINNLDNNKLPRLLLHACCAPCSSYVLEYLSKYFSITVLFYNPNISSEEEYLHRAEELTRFVTENNFDNPVDVIIEELKPEEFYNAVLGLEQCSEGGNRCFICYELRLRKTAEMALKGGFDYFTTTLSISPLKNSDKLNEIGGILEQEFNVKYLYSDFKKKEGYKRSIELSKKYDLYRQNFCGCEFSKRAAEKIIKDFN